MNKRLLPLQLDCFKPGSSLPERAKSRLSRPLRVIVRSMLLLLAGAAGLGSASAQVAPAFRLPPDVGVFGQFTAAQPNIGSGAGAIYGFMAGSYLQTRSPLGFELRGVLQRNGGADHESAALLGPRIAFYSSHLAPYGSLTVGAGYIWRALDPEPGSDYVKKLHGIGFQWMASGGLDIYLKRHLTLRLVEVSVSNIYATGVTQVPVNYSSGLVFRLR